MVSAGWLKLSEEKAKTLILGGLLRRIGNFDPNSFPTSFDARLVFQKTIYLLQAFGLYLGFKFAWYIRGPYSPLLAHHGYQLAKIRGEIPLVRFNRVRSEKKLKQFVDFLGSRKNDPEWLEILASIHLLKKLYPRKSKSKILQSVAEKQPHFSIQKCREAWNHLREHNLIGEKVN